MSPTPAKPNEVANIIEIVEPSLRIKFLTPHLSEVKIGIETFGSFFSKETASF